MRESKGQSAMRKSKGNKKLLPLPYGVVWWG
jgi:hypothetical protein